MPLHHDSCYSALVSRDSRFDGKFFAGVLTTGIYCRPVCPVRKPKYQHVQFFKSAAAAEKAGFRPCLRCRPELAPGYTTADSKTILAMQAKQLLDEMSAHHPGMQNIAAKLGISERYFRQIFQQKFGVRPIEYWQSRRLLTAKQLLTDSELTIAEIAFASGFNSIRRMNSSIKHRYGLTPSGIRKNKPAKSTSEFEFGLSFRPPYAKHQLLNFLYPRLLTGIEHISEDRYSRTLALQHPQNGRIIDGWFGINLAAKNNCFSVSVAQQLLPCFSQLQQYLIRTFDLTNTPEEISLESRKHLPAAVPWVKGLRIPGCIDLFETGVRAILGQQISIELAVRTTQKFIKTFAREVPTPYHFLHRRFPLPAEIAPLDVEDIARIGVFQQRAKAILAWATYCCENTDIAQLSWDPETTITAILRLPGIGPWTANYIALRGLGWQSANLSNDAVISNALWQIYGKKLKQREINELVQQWQPWAGYMCLNLWHWHSSR